MLKVRGTIDTVKSKRVEVKEKGAVVDSTMYWLVTFKVEADQIDANALAHWANLKTVNVAMDTEQLTFDLATTTNAKRRASAAAPA